MTSATQALPITMPSAIADVIRERQRQVTEEKATPTLDDLHTSKQLARAAGTYALFDAVGHPEFLTDLWPDDFTDFKPSDHRRNCVRAAALLLAEIERLDRLAARSAA